MAHSVLVCDDVPAVQTMMRRMLERGGFTVAGLASTADEVLALYRERTPDIVLLDLKMPGATGLDLLRSLRAFDPPACVVMCSGAGDADLHDEAEALGAADWVLKPVYGIALVALLREVLKRAHR